MLSITVSNYLLESDCGFDNQISFVPKPKRSHYYKTSNRKQHIPNPAGYSVTALKENWAGENPISTETKVDTASIFKYWYDLAKQLGYCSGQEMKEGEQLVCVSGAWEKWNNAVERGYSLEYLRKIVKRNKSQ